MLFIQSSDTTVRQMDGESAQLSLTQLFTLKMGLAV